MAMLPRHEAEDLLRPRHRGGDRPARADPGRHGAPVPAPARGAGDAVTYPTPGARAGAREDARRAALPGAGDAGGDRVRRLHALRGRPAAARHGDVQVHGRRHASSATSSIQRHGRARLRRRTSPSAPSSSSRASAPMASRRATPPRFAQIAYASSWMKCHHPDVFCCAHPERAADGLLCAGAARAGCAGQHGVEVRPVDVNHSRWDCTLEPTRNRHRFAVRLGLRLVRGLANADGGMIPIARGESPSRPSRTSGGGPGSRSRPSSAWPRPTRSARSASTGATRSGRSRACADEALPLFAAADERDQRDPLRGRRACRRARRR